MCDLNENIFHCPNNYVRLTKNLFDPEKFHSTKYIRQKIYSTNYIFDQKYIRLKKYIFDKKYILQNVYLTKNIFDKIYIQQKI